MRIGYQRVSTDKQVLHLQTDALKAAGCDRIFGDVASGALDARPGLLEALEFLRAGDVLVVWKLDRLGRNLKHLIEVVEGLERREIGFVSLTEGIDTTTAGGKLVFHIFGAIAEFNRSLLRERTRAGLEAARTRGRTGGRRFRLSDEQKQIGRALLATGDYSHTQICEHLGCSRATFYRHVFPAATSTPNEIPASVGRVEVSLSDS